MTAAVNYKGIVPAMVLPLARDLSIDVVELRRVMRSVDRVDGVRPRCG